MFSPENIYERIHEAIRPQLKFADSLVITYLSDEERVIGKHHPEYDTFYGRLSYLRRRFGDTHGRVRSHEERHGHVI